jgi:tetratricopeptide (TPR) repeat protein
MSIALNPHNFLWSDSLIGFLFGDISFLTMVPFGFLLMYTFMIWFGEEVSPALKKGLVYLLGLGGCAAWFMMLIISEGIKFPEDKGGLTTAAMLVSAILAGYCLVKALSLIGLRLRRAGAAKKEDPEHGQLIREKTLVTRLFIALGSLALTGLIGTKIGAALVTPGDSLYGLLSSLDKVIPILPGFSTTLLLASLIMLFFNRSNPGFKDRASWRKVALIATVALIGFSVQFYTPIRSFLDPVIDENNPEITFDGIVPKNVTAFQYYFERKQYGSEGMISRMFHRRGQFLNQILSHENMGFGSYLAGQLGNWGKFQDLWAGPHKLKALLSGLAYLFPLLAVLWAIMFMWGRDRRHTLYMASLLLAGGIGLMLYMNFADGTVPDWQEMKRYLEAPDRYMKPEPIQMEVRERDYFFTPGFYFFTLWLGLAAACLISLLQEERTRVRGKGLLAGVMAILTLVSPLYPFVNNIGTYSRARNFVAYDYAYNLLQSCAKDALLFTNGDNDTFPLWTLQEAYGIRKDVRIINLSLGNTDWYNSQLLTTEPTVELGLGQNLEKAVEAVKNMNHQRNSFYEGVRGYRLGKTPISVDIPGAKELPIIRIQDKLVIQVVANNYGKRPIYFAVTVSEGNLMGLSPYLTMEGLVFLIDSTKVNTLAQIRGRAEAEEQRLESALKQTGLDGDVAAYLCRPRAETALSFQQKRDTTQCRKWLQGISQGLKKNWTPEKQSELMAAIFQVLAVPAVNLNLSQAVFGQVKAEEQAVFARRMNLEKTSYNMDELYRYRGMGRADVYLEDNTRKLLSNYAAGYIGYLYELKGQMTRLTQEQDRARAALAGKKTADSSAVTAIADSLSLMRKDVANKLNQAIALLPDDWRVRTLATQIYMDDRNYVSAEGVLNQGLLLDPDRYDYNYALGVVYQQQQKRDSAIVLFERLLTELEPAFGDPQKQRRETYQALYMLASLYREQGQKDKARAWVQRWLDHVPNDQNFKRLLSEIDKG